MKKIAIAAILTLCLIPLTSQAGIGKGLVRGAVFGAGATVGHRAAGAAIDSYRDSKAKKAKKQQEESISAKPAPAPTVATARK